MKTSQHITKFLRLSSLLALVFGFSASVAFAGTPPQFRSRPVSVAAANDTPRAAPAPDANGMTCPACKTAAVRTTKHVGPPGKGYDEWIRIGVKHTCTHCGGEIKVVRGVTTNTMTPNCEMCGKDAALCKAAVQTPVAKP